MLKLWILLLSVLALRAAQHYEEKYDEYTKSIDLSGHNIQSLEKYDFSKYARAEEINLSNNQITDIPKDSFLRNTNLKKLDLSGNRNLKIPKDTAFLNSNIEVLNISNCNIHQVPIKIFDQLVNLKIIDFSSNSFEIFDPIVLESINKPQKIILSSDRQIDIEEICGDYEITVGFSNGTSTDCQGHKFENKDDENKKQESQAMPSGVADNSITINLSGQKISSMETYDFSKYKHAEEIDLSGNDIKYIPKDLFLNNTNLKMLNLSGNKHLQIPSNAPFLHSTLSELNLSNCNITQVPIRIFDQLPNLIKIDLSDNPFETLSIEVLESIDPRKIILSRVNQIKAAEICGDSEVTLEIKNTKTISCSDFAPSFHASSNISPEIEQNGLDGKEHKKRAANITTETEPETSNKTEMEPQHVKQPYEIDTDEHEIHTHTDVNTTATPVPGIGSIEPKRNETDVEKDTSDTPKANKETNEDSLNPEIPPPLAQANTTDPLQVKISIPEETQNPETNTKGAEESHSVGLENKDVPSTLLANESDVVEKPRNNETKLDNGEHVGSLDIARISPPHINDTKTQNNTVARSTTNESVEMTTITPTEDQDANFNNTNTKIGKNEQLIVHEDLTGGTPPKSGESTQSAANSTNLIVIVIVAGFVIGAGAFGYKVYHKSTTRTTDANDIEYSKELQEVVADKLKNGTDTARETEPLIGANEENLRLKEIREENDKNDVNNKAGGQDGNRNHDGGNNEANKG